MPPPTPAEYVALGRLQGAVAIVVKSAGPLSALVATPAIGDAAWRTQVVAAVRPIRLAADQARGVNGLGHQPGWRPVVAALERIGTSAEAVEHAILHGNEAGVLLVLRHRLPRDLQELNAAMQGPSRPCRRATPWTRRTPARGVAGVMPHRRGIHPSHMRAYVRPCRGWEA